MGDREFHPFNSESESETSGSQISENESESDSDDNRSNTRDDRMEANDKWRIAAQTWFSKTADKNPILQQQSINESATMKDVPFQLRASDAKRHVLNIDSKFRENPWNTTAGDFWFRLTEPVRNVLRVKVSSIELPNNYRFFTLSRQYTTISILTEANVYDIIIPDGNYLAPEMVAALTAGIALSPDLSGMTVQFADVTGQFTWCAPFPFSINTTRGSHNRPFSYGLGWFLGFSFGIHAAIETSPGSGQYCVTSDGCADFAGDKYLLLKVNDFDCLTHTISVASTNPMESNLIQENAITALAKVILRQSKNYVAFDDYSSQHIKEVVFQNPRDLKRFHIQLLDEFGEPVDLCTAQFSFSLEVIEVLNPSLYDSLRDGITLHYS